MSISIAIYGSRHQDEYVGKIARLIAYLGEQGYRLTFHKKIYDYLLQKDIATEAKDALKQSIFTENEDFKADLALSIGGDGTFLRTAQWIGEKETPIIGVNTGHLGFLAPFSIDEAAEAVEQFRKGETSILERSLLRVDTISGPIEACPYALNEVAIQKKDTASMVNVDAIVNRAPLATYQCDGLIVSTPTGSTGYNLSVGGPIVEPGSPTRIISPIAAHSLSMRPLVVSSESLIELRVNSRAHAFRVSLDGRSITLPSGSAIFVSKADFVVKSVIKRGHNFYETLREKLLWGSAPRRQ